MFQISPWMHFSMDEATVTRRHLVQHSMPKAKQSLTREEVEFACKQLSKKLCLGDREATNWHERALAASVSSRAGLRDTAPECDREVLDACLHKIRYILNGASKATRRQESALVSQGSSAQSGVAVSSSDTMSTLEALEPSSGASATNLSPADVARLTTRPKTEMPRIPQSAAADSDKNDRRRLRYERLVANAPQPTRAAGQIIPRAADIKISRRRPTIWRKVKKQTASTTIPATKLTRSLALQRYPKATRCSRTPPVQGQGIKAFFKKQCATSPGGADNDGASHRPEPCGPRLSAPTACVMDSGSQHTGGQT